MVDNESTAKINDMDLGLFSEQWKRGRGWRRSIFFSVSAFLSLLYNEQRFLIRRGNYIWFGLEGLSLASEGLIWTGFFLFPFFLYPPTLLLIDMDFF